MPSIPVVPESIAELPNNSPILNGVPVPRPNGATKQVETVRSTVALGDGSTRVYDRGFRFVFGLSWSRLTDDALADVEQAVASPVISYRHTDGISYTVETTEGLSSETLPGVFPLRHSASITLRETGVRS